MDYKNQIKFTGNNDNLPQEVSLAYNGTQESYRV